MQGLFIRHLHFPIAFWQKFGISTDSQGAEGESRGAQRGKRRAES